MTNKKSTKLTALLLALVLVTACFIGGTIARYVTSTSSEDNARVAVWGINADDVTMDLFNATYELPDGTVVAQSNDGDNIIAPGTSKDNYFSIINTDDNLAPEVMYEVRINLDDSEIDPLILNNPSIQWRLDDGAYGTWEEVKAQVLALSGDASGVKTYAPLEIAENFKADKVHTIGWRWLMDNNNDEMDTAIANEAIYGDIVAKINVKVTATQVDIDSTGIISGNGVVYNINNPSTLVFKSEAPADELMSVKVNGSELTQGTDYTVTSGSTVITLSEDYLATLEKGNYVISIISKNMTAKAKFSVEEKDVLEHTSMIAQDAIYYKNISLSEYGNYYDVDTYPNATKYNENTAFPKLETGDVYIYNGYEYRYNCRRIDGSWDIIESQNGWGAIYIGSSSYPGEVLKSINGKKVTSMSQAYKFTDVPIMGTPTIHEYITDIFEIANGNNSINTIRIDSNSLTSYTNAFQGSSLCNITGNISEELKALILEDSGLRLINPELAHNGIIPEGGTYYTRVTSMYLGDLTNYTRKYTAGETFPYPQDGDVYVFDGVEYRFEKVYEHFQYDEFDWDYRWLDDSYSNTWGGEIFNNSSTTSLEMINGKYVNIGNIE